jgi:hypothetical protein
VSINDSARQEQQRRESQRVQREAQRQAQERFRRLQKNSQESFRRGQDALAHQRIRASHRRRRVETQGQDPLLLPGEHASTPTRHHRMRSALVLTCIALAVAVGIYFGLRSSGIAGGGVSGTVHSGSAWNLRAGPSAKSAIVGRVEPGDHVIINCLTGAWAKLKAPREGVFVSARGLSYREEPPVC